MCIVVQRKTTRKEQVLLLGVLGEAERLFQTRVLRLCGEFVVKSMRRSTDHTC